MDDRTENPLLTALIGIAENALDTLKASDYERVCNEMPNVAYLLNDVLRGSKREVKAMRDNGPTT